jgi:hypothetical protein
VARSVRVTNNVQRRGSEVCRAEGRGATLEPSSKSRSLTTVRKERGRVWDDSSPFFERLLNLLAH